VVPTQRAAASLASSAPQPPPSRSGAGRPGRLVGGVLPDTVLAGLEAGLADLARSEHDRDRSGAAGRLLDWLRVRPVIAATVGAVAVVAVLLALMTVLGLVT
jgi:hypothetical protein